jgi:hypothetical protein
MDEEGFKSFIPKVQGALFKITPLTSQTSANVEAYVHGGSMGRDLVYIRSLYGLVNPSQKREFSFFWESPWVEEHIKDTSKKRKMEEQQKALAVRTYIRSSASIQQQQEPEDLDKFLSNVSKLTEWEEQNKNSAKETVKTVSRIVQSFEKKAVRNILNLLESGTVNKAIALNHLNRLRGGLHGDVDAICHTLRRSSITYDCFASLVSAEILFSDGTNGSRNTSIHLSKRLDFERQMASATLIDVLHRITSSSMLPRDTLGLPLMETNCKLFVSKGVLVLSGDADRATYILNVDDIDDVLNSSKKKPKTIEISAQIFSEEDAAEYEAKGLQERKKMKLTPFTSLV